VNVIKLEDWHPVLLVALISLIPTVSGVAVLLLMVYRIPPVIFFPVAAAAILILQSYVYAMHKYFKERKLWKLTTLAVVLALIFIAPYSVYAIVTPSWSFSVSTNKTVYRLGENVTITATLTNNGLITHSFSTEKYPLYVTFDVQSLLHGIESSVWGSSVPLNQSELSLGPGRSIELTVVWNQTTIQLVGHVLKPASPASSGDYLVLVEVRSNSYDVVFFQDSVRITIEQ
jgi:hypothetical protein